MLSKPDFVEKQIIVIGCEQLKSLSLKNDNLLIKQGDKTVNQLSCSKIFCIFIMGDCTISTRVVRELLKYQICIYCLSSSLKPLFVIGNSLEGNYLLRESQYRFQESDNLNLAKQLITNKVSNQLHLLKNLRNKDESTNNAIEQICQIIIKIETSNSPDTLRGLEGNAAKLFFGSYFKEIGRYRRAPRTREDSINLLLDIGYSYLYGIVEAHLSLYGFDIYKGFFHTQFFERKSLVCDLVEPLRCLVDHTIRKAYNLKQINPKNFKKINGEYTIDREEKKKYSALFLKIIIEHKEEIFVYIKGYYRMMMTKDSNLPTFTSHKIQSC